MHCCTVYLSGALIEEAVPVGWRRVRLDRTNDVQLGSLP